jgi:hypothetical protein
LEEGVEALFRAPEFTNLDDMIGSKAQRHRGRRT